MSRLPTLPNGVSARAANAATPAGSVYTACSTDGMSQGKLPTASAVSGTATAASRLLLTAVVAATGTTTSAVIAIAANPPATAGNSATASRAAPRQEVRGARSGLSMARSTQGRPA